MNKQQPKVSNDLREYNHIALLFPSRYLCAADLRGKDVTVVIESIAPRDELVRIGGGKEHKPVMKFKGKEKALVLNRTNAKAIAKLYGNEVLAWIGKSITIYPTTATFGKEQVEAIRVRPRTPNGSARAEEGQLASKPPPPTRCPGCGVNFSDPDEADAHTCGDAVQP